ncbi:MAG TPA: hypothetical protein DCL48_07990, partial [Alphaproteobacteria bacterium]|nr:hypothetical protein [Alphaproteobacteria bacterium]
MVPPNPGLRVSVAPSGPVLYRCFAKGLTLFISRHEGVTPMRRIMTLWAVLMIAVVSLGTGIARAAEEDTDRPGGDYREFSVPFGGDYRSCESACNSDGRCRAWTYLRSDTFPPTGGQCYLKDRVSPPTPNDCCVSGLKTIGGGGGGRGVTVFQDVNFGGDRETFNRDVPNLVPEGWNDQISSFRIPSGETWQFCESINYTGRCVSANSDTANLFGAGLNDRISSMRRLSGGRPGPGPGPGRAGITVFEDVGYRGNSQTFAAAISNLVPEGWNDVISSFRIRGGSWEVCQDTNFRGRCRIFNADVDNLVSLGWNDRISSLRPVGGSRPGDGEDDWSVGPGMRDGFDRPGGDYRDFDVSRGGPAVCADTCNRDSACRAWSFMRPARFGVAPKCYLKGVATAERRDARFISGVSTSREAIGPRMDDGADRSDNSYRTFNLTEANPRRCQEACDGDRRCRAWTY